MQILIHIPNSFIAERTYIIDVFFKDFLGLDYRIDIEEDISYYKIVLPNLKVLIIEDCFFEKYKSDENYLLIETLPTLIVRVSNQFVSEDDLPLIYGNSKLEITDNQILCGCDIFSSAFFMLTRWEEYVVKDKDSHERFPCEKSLIQRENLHYRPLVNEYCEFLWNAIRFLGYQGKRKCTDFELVPTHDIDWFERYDSFSKFARALVGDLVKRKNPLLMLETLTDYLKIKLGFKKDSYNTFDFLMNTSEKLGVKSHVYFMIGQKNEKDITYSITNDRLTNTIRQIIERDHIVGIHGSYQSYNQQSIYSSNLNTLQTLCSVTENRQHYLRFENPLTFQILENAGIQKDSTLGFSNDGGFRCGTCYEFPVFDILQRKTLNIKEMPLIAMETALHRKYPDDKDFEVAFRTLLDTVKKYKGKFVFLWHNSNLTIHQWKNGKNFYTQLLNNL